VRRGQGEKLPDIVWLKTDGTEMLPEDWGSGFGRTIGVFYNGDGIQEQDSRGRRITDDSFLMAFNAHDDDVDFLLPTDEYSQYWEVLIDTAAQADAYEPLKAGATLTLEAKSMVVLRAYSGPEAEVDLSAAASLASMAEQEEAQEEMVEAQTKAAAESEAKATGADQESAGKDADATAAGKEPVGKDAAE
jgi:glycogen operon protein